MWSHDSSSMSLSKPTVTGVSMLIWLTRGVLRQPRPGAADSMQQAGLVVCQPRKRVRTIALFNQNPMSVGYSGRPGNRVSRVDVVDIPSGV